MTMAPERTPAPPAGVRPTHKTPSTSDLRKLGSYVTVMQEDLEESDVIIRDGSAFCIVRKDLTYRRGTSVVLRELGTNTIHRMMIQPRARVSWLKLPDVITTLHGNWRIHSGDVVLYPATRPQDSVASIRQSRGWHRTAPPWTPLSDAETLLDLREGRAVMIRSSARPSGVDPKHPFNKGSMVASRVISDKDEPSVWIRLMPDFWVSDSRGATASDQMIRHELRRGTYQVLCDPWNIVP